MTPLSTRVDWDGMEEREMVAILVEFAGLPYDFALEAVRSDDPAIRRGVDGILGLRRSLDRFHERMEYHRRRLRAVGR
jgi:hypothetical protein